MKKTKLLSLLGMGVLSLSALSACSGGNEISFWHGFGSTVTADLKRVITNFTAIDGAKIADTSSGGGYDGLYDQITGSVSNKKYPDMAVAYPDHMATYVGVKILLQLDDQLEAAGINLDDYVPEYVKENQSLAVYGSAHALAGQKITYGIPFNKSTETLTANEGFFEWAALENAAIVVPETWEDMHSVGLLIRALVVDKDLFKGGVVRSYAEPYVYHTYKLDGDNRKITNNAELNGQVINLNDYEIIYDMEKVNDIDMFRPFAVDSPENLFITFLNQYDVENKGIYTHQGKKDDGSPDIYSGTYRFTMQENWDYAVGEALGFMAKLGYDKIMGVPTTWGGSALYSSELFKAGQIVGTIGSSAGVYNNILTNGEIGSYPIPYPAGKKKAVISQGTNLVLFQKQEKNARNLEALKFLTTSEIKEVTAEEEPNYSYKDGEVQKHYKVTGNLDFSMRTGYFPVEKSARDHDIYKDYLAGKLIPGDNKTEKSKVGVANLNMNTYLEEVEVEGEMQRVWTLFVDAAFDGSSAIRRAVTYIPTNLFKTGTWTGINLSDANAVSNTIKEIVRGAVTSGGIISNHQPKGVTLI